MSFTHNFSTHRTSVKRAALFVVYAFLLLAFRFAIAAPHEEPKATPLMNAAFAGNISAIKALIDTGANVNEGNAYGDTPLHYTLRRTSLGRRKGRIGVVAMLVTHGANVNSRASNGTTPLMEASGIGDTDAVTYLLEHGALLNSADAAGRTALSLAARQLYSDIVLTLVARGANTDIRDDQGRTPLMWAIDAVSFPVPPQSDERTAQQKELLPIVELLLAHRVDVNSADKSGWTPLALAVDRDSPDVVDALVNHGANIDVPVSSMGNETPLMLAIRRNSQRMLKTLIAAKPDFSLVNSQGRTALSYARGYRDTDMIEMLQKAGAVR